MAIKKPRSTGHNRVPNDPLDWVGDIDREDTASSPVKTEEQSPSTVSDKVKQPRVSIEIEQEKTMPDSKNVELSALNEITNKIQQVAQSLEQGVFNASIDTEQVDSQIRPVCTAVNGIIGNLAQQVQLQQTALLDSLSSCIQLADRNNVITYMNNALMEMFAAAENDIRQYLPHFDRNKLLGQSMDIFHKNPAHQQHLVNTMQDRYTAKIKLGERVFELVAVPLFDFTGKRSGTLVEWSDVSVMENISEVLAGVANGDLTKPLVSADLCKGTEKILQESAQLMRENVNHLMTDINILAQAAIDGSLNTRVYAYEHQGQFRVIVQGVNDILDAVIKPLQNLSSVIEALGENDLSMDIEGEFYGDFLRIKESFENSLLRMNNTLHHISDTVDHLATSADELSAASQHMAATSEQQSAAVEEVTSSLEETDSQIRANTDNANAANQLVIDTSQIANLGQQKMESMIAAMGTINDASQNIAKIIKVIDEIAFQTNLLALNAAVEAARAGQHGRGFAVVAQEVRNLAGRSAKAARETADLIDDSSKRVAEGVHIANQTREALEQIVGNVVKVKDLVAEITAASIEQSRGVSQINIAMNQVSKAAQEGSQQAEELASSASALNNMSEQMRREMSRFRLKVADEQLGDGSLNLDNLSPEIIKQLKMLLSAYPSSTHQAGTASSAGSSIASKSPRSILPLDADERGFGDF